MEERETFKAKASRIPKSRVLAKLHESRIVPPRNYEQKASQNFGKQLTRNVIFGRQAKPLHENTIPDFEVSKTKLKSFLSISKSSEDISMRSKGSHPRKINDMSYRELKNQYLLASKEQQSMKTEMSEMSEKIESMKVFSVLCASC